MVALGIIAIISLSLIPRAIINTYAQPNWIGDKREIRTGKVVIRLPRSQPEYFISSTSKENIGYSVKFLQLIEFIDTNGNNLLDKDEVALSRGILCGQVSWDIDVEQNETALEVKLSSHIRVIYHGPMMGPPKTAYVEIRNTIFTHETSINGYDIMSEQEVKIDIIVMNWPWRAQNSLLSLRVIFGTYHGEEITYGRKMANEHRKDPRHNVDSIMMRDPGLDYGILFRVRESIKVDGLNKTMQAMNWRDNNTLEITYPHFDDVLIHDPSIRIIELVAEKIGFMGWFAGAIMVIISALISYLSIISLRKKIKRALAS